MFDNKTIVASVVVLLLAVIAVASITEGFELLTSEQARRQDIARCQPSVPNPILTSQFGQDFRLGDWVKQGGKYVIVDFIYTNCQTLCRTLGSEFQQLQRHIEQTGLKSRIHLLSISFDPSHDNADVLRRYAEQMQANTEIWTFATVASINDLQPLLNSFGITVIPDQMGGFQHNAALIWVAPSGKLVSVSDFEDVDSFLNNLLRPK